jgi:RimJ/RimL family protein N-acetyltransferase
MVTRVPDAPLSAGAFVLRAWKPEDAASYLQGRDHEVFRWTTEKRETTADELASTIAQNLERPEWVALAISRSDDQIVGNISLVPQAGGTSAEASYWLAPEGRGSGAATAALEALTDWAFANLDIECVFLKIAPDNTRSLAVAQRCGFVEAPPHDERLRLERRRPDERASAR